MTPPDADAEVETPEDFLYQSIVLFLLVEWAKNADHEFGADDASGRRWFGPGDPDAHGGQHDLFAILAPPWLIDGIVAYVLRHSETNPGEMHHDAIKAN